MHQLFDMYSYCSQDKAQQLDKLLTFLLERFDQEVKQHETYNQVAGNTVITDFTLPDIVGTLDAIIQNLNYLKHNTEELDTRTMLFEQRLSNVESDIQMLIARVTTIEKKLSDNK